MDKIKNLPVVAQVIIIITLLYCTWHFRFYTTGVDESELTKVEGVLHSFRCVENIKGADTIIMNTSLLDEEIWFEGWQKCGFLEGVMSYSNSPQQVVFYTKLHKGILNPEGSIWIYAVDFKSTGDQFIYPKNGLGAKSKANFIIMVLPVIALILFQGLVGRWKRNRTNIF